MSSTILTKSKWDYAGKTPSWMWYVHYQSYGFVFSFLWFLPWTLKKVIVGLNNLYRDSNRLDYLPTRKRSRWSLKMRLCRKYMVGRMYLILLWLLDTKLFSCLGIFFHQVFMKIAIYPLSNNCTYLHILASLRSLI